MTENNTLVGLDPRHTFLSAREVFARYGWGKSQGYVHIKTAGFPRPVPGGKYRLDTLMKWEDGQTGPDDPRPDETGAAAPSGLGPDAPAGPPAKRTAGRKAAA